MITIYALVENNLVRFIGKTSKSNLQEKLDQHINEAKTDPEKFGWISHLLSNGNPIEIKPVLTYHEEDAPYYEKLFMNDFKFFVGLKAGSIEVSTPQSVLKDMQARARVNLQAAY